MTPMWAWLSVLISTLIGVLLGRLGVATNTRRIQRSKSYSISRRVAQRGYYVALGTATGLPRRPDHKSDWAYARSVHQALVGADIPYGVDLVVDKRHGRQVLESDGLVHLAIQLRHDKHATSAYLCDPDRLAPDPRWEQDARRVTCCRCVARDP